jgi:hypothetical protein
MRKKKIKCELFNLITDRERNVSKDSNAIIIGKTIYISNLTNGFVFNDNYKSSYPYNYSFDIPIDDVVTLVDGCRKGKINTKISYQKSNISLDYYTHLSWQQRWTVNKWFGNLWLQKNSNIMWIINVLVAIGAIIASFYRK